MLNLLHLISGFVLLKLRRIYQGCIVGISGSSKEEVFIGAYHPNPTAYSHYLVSIYTSIWSIYNHLHPSMWRNCPS